MSFCTYRNLSHSYIYSQGSGNLINIGHIKNQWPSLVFGCFCPFSNRELWSVVRCSNWAVLLHYHINDAVSLFKYCLAGNKWTWMDRSKIKLLTLTFLDYFSCGLRINQPDQQKKNEEVTF